MARARVAYNNMGNTVKDSMRILWKQKKNDIKVHMYKVRLQPLPFPFPIRTNIHVRLAAHTYGDLNANCVHKWRGSQTVSQQGMHSDRVESRKPRGALYVYVYACRKYLLRFYLTAHTHEYLSIVH